MTFAGAPALVCLQSLPSVFLHQPSHSHSAYSSPASSPPTSATARRRLVPTQYTPSSDSSSSSSYASLDDRTSQYAASTTHMQYGNGQTLPPLSSIVPPTSSVDVYASPAHLRQRTGPQQQQLYQNQQSQQQQQPIATTMQISIDTRPQLLHPSSSAYQQQPLSAQPYSSLAPAMRTPEQPAQPVAGPSTQPQPTPETTRKRARTADFVASNTCAMVCYLWFGTPRPPPPSPSPSTRNGPSPYSPTFTAPPTDPQLARLQFMPSKAFVDFMHSLLTTTQVSQSVIVLSLHYIYRLKCANPDIKVMPGSEMRLAVAALMLANKFLDDNTYTNLTWSQISHISLNEINLMEREFLLGMNFNLFIDQKAYEGWLLMLNGLMWAKEREYEGWRRVWYGQQARLSVVTNLAEQVVPPHRVAAPTRARSTSPVGQAFPFTFTLPPLQQPVSNPFTNRIPPPSLPQQPPYQQQPLQPPPIPIATRPTTTGSKRTAGDALFSPEPRQPAPNKRPISSVFPSGMDYTVQQPAMEHSGNMINAESLALGAALGRMSLEPTAPPVPHVIVKKEEEEEESVFGGGSTVSQLTAPYRADEQLAGRGVPRYLAFNTLVASPLEGGPSQSQQATPQPPQQAVHYHQHEHQSIPPPAQPQQYAQQPSQLSQHYPYAPQTLSQAQAHQHQRKTVTRYQVHQPLPHSYNLPPPQQPQQQYGAFAAAHFNATRSARTSPTMDVDMSQPFRFQPPFQQQQQPVQPAPAQQPVQQYQQAPPQYAPSQQFANAGPPGYQWNARWQAYAQPQAQGRYAPPNHPHMAYHHPATSHPTQATM